MNCDVTMTSFLCFHQRKGLTVKNVNDVLMTSNCKFMLLFELSSPNLGPVHMTPGQLIAPGQLTDPGVNFASVHGLKPVTVHMSFSLPRDNFERRVTRCTTRVTRLAEVIFLQVNRTQKLPRGKSSLAHAHY